jgi:hypothetical protein
MQILDEVVLLGPSGIAWGWSWDFIRNLSYRITGTGPLGSSGPIFNLRK